MRRLLGTVLLVLALTGCNDDPDGPAPGPDGRGSPPAEPTDTTAPAGLEEVPPGYDESPDGAPPVADADLDARALTALLRTRASAPADGHCTADQVTVSLEGFDMSLGHRYSRIVVRNDSSSGCVVEGVPGIGVRGAWGSRFVPEVDHTDRDLNGGAISAAPIRLDPGERAAAGIEWTGDLAGAESEQASLIVVQLASGQVPAAVPAIAAGGPVDIGQFTTIHLAPFVAG